MRPMKSRDRNAHGPFPTPVITSDTKNGGASRAEQEGESDGGRDGCLGNAVKLGKGCDGQGNGVDWWPNCEKEMMNKVRRD